MYVIHANCSIPFFFTQSKNNNTTFILIGETGECGPEFCRATSVGSHYFYGLKFTLGLLNLSHYISQCILLHGILTKFLES